MKKFLKKLIGFSLGPIIGAVISFVLTPIISYIVSADQFGLANMFTLANNIITLIVLMGADQAFIREYNEIKDKKKLLYNSLLIPFATTVVIGIILVIFKNQFAVMLFDDATVTKPIILLAIFTPLFIIEKFMLLILRMQEKALQYSIWNVISKALNFALTIAFLLLYKKNFESIVYATIFSQLIVSVALLIVCKKHIRISREYFDKQQIKSLMKFGIPLIPAALIGWGLNSMDSVFLRIMTDYTELGYYGVALKVANVLALIQTCFTTFWSPLAFKWKAQNENNEKFEMVSYGVSCIMSIILILILLLKNAIPLIFGEGYNVIVYIIPFLLFHPIFYTMSETTILGIFFSRKTGYNILISLIAMVANLILNFILIPIYGAIGASIATGLSYMIFFWARTLISRKFWFKFKLMHYFIISVLLIVVSLLNCIITDIAMISIINISGIIIVLAVYNKAIAKIVLYVKKSKNDAKAQIEE